MIESLLAWGRPEVQIGSEELWQGLRCLDLYAGSGALGIEALSRGAERATFVESIPDAVASIRANLQATGLADRAEVRAGDARRLLTSLTGPIDLVLLDPPYTDTAAVGSVEAIERASWLADDAIVGFEHSRRLAAPDKLGTLKRQRDRAYGSTVLTVYARGRFDREAAEGVG